MLITGAPSNFFTLVPERRITWVFSFFLLEVHLNLNHVCVIVIRNYFDHFASTRLLLLLCALPFNCFFCPTCILMFAQCSIAYERLSKAAGVSRNKQKAFRASYYLLNVALQWQNVRWLWNNLFRFKVASFLKHPFLLSLNWCHEHN